MVLFVVKTQFEADKIASTIKKTYDDANAKYGGVTKFHNDLIQQQASLL